MTAPISLITEGCRFIQNKELWFTGQRPANGELLLLPPRRERHPFAVSFQATPGKGHNILRHAFRLATGKSRQSHQQIFLNGQAREDFPALRYIGNALLPPLMWLTVVD